MLHYYLDENQAYSLVNSLKKRSKPTVYCFQGSGNNGKTTVIRHFSNLLSDIYPIFEYTPEVLKTVQKNIKYIMVEVKTEQESFQIKEWAIKKGFTFELYMFNEDMNHN